MIIINTQTKEESFVISGSESNSIFDIPEDECVRFCDEVNYDLLVNKTSKDLIITGSTSTSVSFECFRCLKSFSKKLKIKTLLYAFPLEELDEKLDLTPFIREEFLLRIPLMPLCSKECKGFCLICGIDLNKDSCGCSKKSKDSAFDVLDGLDI